jgi:LacI family transcriptional regulator
VLIPDLNNPLFPPIIRGIEDRLGEHGYVALIGNTDADPGKERLVFDQMRARHVDGFVLATATLNSPILGEAAQAALPLVLVNRTAQDYPFSSVSVDNEQGVRAAVAHLISLGHTRIGHIAGPQDISTGVARLRGGTGLTAIVAANDMLAVGCYGALDALGLRCPEDVSVIGFNDMPFVDRLHPPLSTVRFPHYQLGTEAARLLIERIENGEGNPVKILFLAAELIARGSTVAVERSGGQAQPVVSAGTPPSGRRRSGA